MVSHPTFASEEYFTQEEFADWVLGYWDDLNRFELLNGRIVMTPPSGWPQGEASFKVAGLLFTAVGTARSGRAFGADQGFELPSGDTVGPDAAYVSNERWHAMPEPQPDKFLRVVPDLIVEILSPSTASRDRGEKRAIYERNGVTEYVLLDCRTRRILRFVLKDGSYGRPDEIGEGASLPSAVLPGLVWSISELVPT